MDAFGQQRGAAGQKGRRELRHADAEIGREGAVHGPGASVRTGLHRSTEHAIRPFQVAHTSVAAGITSAKEIDAEAKHSEQNA